MHEAGLFVHDHKTAIPSFRAGRDESRAGSRSGRRGGRRALRLELVSPSARALSDREVGARGASRGYASRARVQARADRALSRGLHRECAVGGEASPGHYRRACGHVLASLWRDRPIISRLVLSDADVDMERQADGLRNWRLRHPTTGAPAGSRSFRWKRIAARSISSTVGSASTSSQPPVRRATNA